MKLSYPNLQNEGLYTDKKPHTHHILFVNVKPVPSVTPDPCSSKLELLLN